MPGPGADMDTAAVEAHGKALADTGERLSDNYKLYNADITQGIPGIGTGDILSQAFRPTHDPDARWTREVAGQLPAQFDRLGTAAEVSARDYVRVDQIAAAGMPR
jgi:hypothetical protein